MNTQKPYQMKTFQKPFQKPILMDAFPPLGSVPAKPKPVLDFKKTVSTPVAQAVTQTQTQTQNKSHVPVKNLSHIVTSPPKKHVSYTRYGDDFPEDYDGPPEEDFDDEEEEEEEEEEYVSTRRRGDRGIW
jgi:hypothetical protein